MTALPGPRVRSRPEIRAAGPKPPDPLQPTMHLSLGDRWADAQRPHKSSAPPKTQGFSLVVQHTACSNGGKKLCFPVTSNFCLRPTRVCLARNHLRPCMASDLQFGDKKGTLSETGVPEEKEGGQLLGPEGGPWDLVVDMPKRCGRLDSSNATPLAAWELRKTKQVVAALCTEKGVQRRRFTDRLRVVALVDSLFSELGCYWFSLRSLAPQLCGQNCWLVSQLIHCLDSWAPARELCALLLEGSALN